MRRRPPPASRRWDSPRPADQDMQPALPCNLRSLAIAALFQCGGVEGPAAENLVTAITRVISPAALVSVLFSALHVERLAQNFALVHVRFIDTLEERHIVGVGGFRTQ